MRILGLDIGGANIKAASNDGWVAEQSFPLWKRPQDLSSALGTLTHGQRFEQVAITMTGELADGYATKIEGVSQILDAVEATYQSTVRVWQTAGEFVDPKIAREHWQLTAAANWHALATWIGRVSPAGNALLIDVGSTTCDIIPIERGCPVSHGRTDVTRLSHSELVYTGIERTPLCAVLPAVRVNEDLIQTAAEWFATSGDVWRVLGQLPEETSNSNTADGRPRTVKHSAQRIARTICADECELSDGTIKDLAHQYATSQQALISNAVERVVSDSLSSRVETVVISGAGEFLIELAIQNLLQRHDCDVIKLSALLGENLSAAACAHAVATLASEN